MKAFITILSLAIVGLAMTKNIRPPPLLAVRDTEDHSIANLVAFGKGPISDFLRLQLALPGTLLGKDLQRVLLRLNRKFGDTNVLRYDHGLEIVLGLAYLENAKRDRSLIQVRGDVSNITFYTEVPNVSPEAPTTTPEASTSTPLATTPEASTASSPDLPTNNGTTLPPPPFDEYDLDAYLVGITHLVNSFELLRYSYNAEIREAYLRVAFFGGRPEHEEVLAFLLIQRGVRTLERAHLLPRELVPVLY